MSRSLLLIIDMQKAMESEPAYNYEKVKGNIKLLLNKYREEGLPVVFVQHEGKEGSVLSKGSSGWEIIDEITPLDGEVIVNKRFNSGFKETELKDVLDSYTPKEIVVTGMQTEFCVDTTIRVAFEKGYNLVIPKETNTTFDAKVISGKEIYEHHNAIWNGRFGKVLDIKELL